MIKDPRENGVDPTKNVKELVEAANRRTDDMRAGDVKRMDDLREAEARRIDGNSKAEARRVNGLMRQAAFYEEKLREAEAKRIDANRAGDTNAITTLAASVSSTAQALATQFTGIITPINERLASLEKAQYEAYGRRVVEDPHQSARDIEIGGALSALAKQVAGLRESRVEGGGKEQGAKDTKQGMSASTMLVVGIVGVLIAMIGTGFTVYALLK